MTQLSRYAAQAKNAISAACDELRDITAALDARQRERRMQALRQMHPTQIIELLEDIAKTAGPFVVSRLDLMSGRAADGNTWVHASIGEVIGELQAMYVLEIEALRNSYNEARYDISGNVIRSRELAEEDAERIDENWKWGD